MDISLSGVADCNEERLSPTSAPTDCRDSHSPSDHATDGASRQCTLTMGAIIDHRTTIPSRKGVLPEGGQGVFATRISADVLPQSGGRLYCSISQILSHIPCGNRCPYWQAIVRAPAPAPCPLSPCPLRYLTTAPHRRRRYR
jgi:hypothetical protein